jgi:nondiscriminating glutamyl-tRNA synthetase
MSENNVKVRFAPSPTGYLHIGGLRTALFNYLFAKHNNGKFILRIEDTDQTRKVEGAVDNLIHTLKYMGLEYDEGPGLEGENGPYFQSQRLGIYQRYIKELIEKGHAYYAFETPKELEEMRRIQHVQGIQTMYDRRARNLTENEVKDKLNKDIPNVIRLKVPLDSEIKFHDLIRGNVKMETNLIDDQVLLKSDGFPTYHFANVVDDHLMNITHVIRGEEWLTSVPKHILLYKALDWEVPKMAHVPLILNYDKTKLSKRQGDVTTEDFLKKGYLKEALLNFIALLGWNPGDGDNREIFSINELIKLFSIEKVNSSGAVFDIEKLNWMNAEYIKSYDIDKLLELSIPFVGNDLDRDKFKRILIVERNYVKKLSELPVRILQDFEKDPVLGFEGQGIVNSEDSKKVIGLLNRKLENLSEITMDNFKPLLAEIQTETGIKGKSLYQPIRLALTGEDHGPELGLIAYVLGKEEIIDRLNRLLE